MLTVSDLFKAAILPGTSQFRKTAARVTIDVTESTISLDAVTAADEAAFSVAAEIVDDIVTNDYLIATCEPNLWKLDGSVIFDPATPGHVGYVSDSQAESDGLFAIASVYAGGGGLGFITRFNQSGMASVLSSESVEYDFDIYAVATDGAFIYISGYPIYEYDSNKLRIYKLEPTGLTLVSESDIIVDKGVNSLCTDGTYLYAACSNGTGDFNSVIRKYRLSDLSFVMESESYAYDFIGSLAFDGAYLYAAGSTQKIYKYDVADMSKIGESGDYGGTIRAITIYGSYIYAAGYTTEKVYKYLLSDLSKTAESVGYGGDIYALTADATNIYAAGITTGSVYKFLQSDLSKIGESAVLDGAIYSLCVDADYSHIYAGGDLGGVYQLLPADMSTVATADYGNCVFSLSSLNKTNPVISITTLLDFAGPGLTLFFDQLGGGYPIEFTVEILFESAVLQTISVTDNDTPYVVIDEFINPDYDSVDEIRLTFIKMSRPYARARLSELFVGIKQQYGPVSDPGLFNLSVISDSDPTGMTLPTGQAIVRIDNTSGDYNPFIPAGVAEWLQAGALMTVEWGVYLNASLIEWVKSGSYLFAEWREVDYKQVDLVGMDTNGYYGSLPAYAQYEGWTRNGAVETYISDVLSYADIPATKYDVTPFPNMDAGFMAGPAASTILEESRLMAQWLCRICRVDPDGVIEFVELPALPTETISLDDCYELPATTRQALVASVDVNIYTATLGADVEVVAIHKETFTGSRTIKVWVGWDFGLLSAVVTGASSSIDLSFSYGYYVVTPTGTGAEVTVTVSGKRYTISKSVYSLANPNAVDSRASALAIDNPHICTRERAVLVADWTLANLDRLLKLTYEWRASPVIEPLDLRWSETSYGYKNMLVTRQDIDFDGFMSGRIEGVV